MQIQAVFCVGSNPGDGLDGLFCPARQTGGTAIALWAKVGGANATVFTSTGPWADGSKQVLSQVKQMPCLIAISARRKCLPKRPCNAAAQ